MIRTDQSAAPDTLDTCNCCEGLTAQTPAVVENQPSLSVIAYRVGTHAQFKASLLAGLSTAHLWPLQALRTRRDDDWTIALLDAWAVVGDVLAFYNERIANENYLRTATERRSILELARLTGYELQPGVAASTLLAFTVEAAKGAPQITTVPVGTKVQSVPGPDEQAQTYETVEPIEARAAWNAMQPRLFQRHPIVLQAEGPTPFLFAGIATGLKQGDHLVVTPDGTTPVLCVVGAVTPQPAHDRTEVLLQPASFSSAPTLARATQSTASAMLPFQAYSHGDGHTTKQSSVTTHYLNTTVDASYFKAAAITQQFIVQEVFDNLTATRPLPPRVVALRMRAALWGHNAPALSALPYSMREYEAVYSADPDDKASFVTGVVPGPYRGRSSTWADATLTAYLGYLAGLKPPQEQANSTGVYLDNTYPAITKNSYVVLKGQHTWQLYQVSATTELSLADFTLSAKVTRLTLNHNDGFGSFRMRDTILLGQSEPLDLARMPITTPVQGREIELDGWIDGLLAGQKLIVCGERDDMRGVAVCEAVVIVQVEQVLTQDGFTRLTLQGDLAYRYVRATVRIYGNVADATHGESVKEVLGSGDGSQAFQRFTLRQPPLTYTASSAANGATTTLKLYVNDILWHEVPTLYGHGPTERMYITRTDDDGKTTVQFGDGITGARLPTGQENVRAEYRKGVGLAGQVKAEQLSLLLSRPAGVKGVINPLATTGADEPEVLADARENVPLTVLTLGRIVSLQDYEDFARSFTGIAKALATWTWNGQQRGVLLTIAGPDGQAITPQSKTHTNLLTAIAAVGDPYVPVQVKAYQRQLFRVQANLKLDPDYLPPLVKAEAERALRTTFAFDARRFGQPVALSEVIATLHAVPGVLAVDVDKLLRSDPDAPSATTDLPAQLVAVLPQPGDAGTPAAALLTLDPAPIVFGVMP